MGLIPQQCETEKLYYAKTFGRYSHGGKKFFFFKLSPKNPGACVIES